MLSQNIQVKVLMFIIIGIKLYSTFIDRRYYQIRPEKLWLLTFYNIIIITKTSRLLGKVRSVNEVENWERRCAY